MPRPRVTCAVAGTDDANSGPRMISAPSSSACWDGLLRALRAAAVILDQKLDIGIEEFRQRHLGGFLHRFRRDGRIARRRQRQNQTDLDLPGTDRNRLLRRSRGIVRGLRTERIGKLAQALLHARASAKHRRAQNQAKRGPPGCLRTRNPGLVEDLVFDWLSWLSEPAQVETWHRTGPPSYLFSWPTLTRPDVALPTYQEGGFRHIVGE